MNDKELKQLERKRYREKRRRVSLKAKGYVQLIMWVPAELKPVLVTHLKNAVMQWQEAIGNNNVKNKKLPVDRD